MAPIIEAVSKRLHSVQRESVGVDVGANVGVGVDVDVGVDAGVGVDVACDSLRAGGGGGEGDPPGVLRSGTSFSGVAIGSFVALVALGSASLDSDGFFIVTLID